MTSGINPSRLDETRERGHSAEIRYQCVKKIERELQVVDSAKLRDLIASYRSQARAPSLTVELKRYNEEMADYLEAVADTVDGAQLSGRCDNLASPAPA
jgi:hypothetical protein